MQTYTDTYTIHVYSYIKIDTDNDMLDYYLRTKRSEWSYMQHG